MADVEQGKCTEYRVLMTGGCGYVGTHTLVRLLEENVQVVVVDNLATLQVDSNPPKNEKPECLKRVEKISGKQVAFYNVDMADEAALDHVFDMHQIDCVIHLAALKSVADSCRQPLAYYKNNVGGTITLLEVMKKHRVNKLVFSSSATVYGDPQYLPVDESHVTGQKVTNPYGRTKYFIEEILNDLCSSDPSWCVACLRYFNPVGAHPSGQIGEDPTGVPCNLMPYVAQVAVGRLQTLKVYGSDYPTPDGTGVRDYIHIMDLAEGHWAAASEILRKDRTGWQAYNLGLGRGYSVLEVVKAFERASGRPIAVEMAERRQGDVSASYSDCSLAAGQLDWVAKRSLQDMCSDMWRWQSMNPNGYCSQSGGESEHQGTPPQ